MCKIIRRSALVLCVLALCISAMGVTVCAASTATASIPVQILLRGTEPAVPETFVVEVTGSDSTSPLPVGGKNGVYKMELEGNSAGTIVFMFDQPGVYNYTVRQAAGSNGDCKYDDSVYHLTAFVTGSAAGSGWDLSVALYRGGESEKREGILFENETKNDSPQTGDGFQLQLWIMLLALSFSGIILSLVSKKSAERDLWHRP